MSSPTLIFDFGGVLIDWDPHYLYRKLLPDDAAVARFLHEVDFAAWNVLQDAGRPFAEAVQELSGRFPHYESLISAYHTRWIESLGGPIWPNVEVLTELHRRGERLFALSNWSAETFAQVRPQYEFLNYFEKIILSGEVGLVKPDPRIFELTWQAVGRPAGECLLIDDSPANIAAAKKLGFQTIHLPTGADLRAALQAKGLL